MTGYKKTEKVIKVGCTLEISEWLTSEQHRKASSLSETARVMDLHPVKSERVEGDRSSEHSSLQSEKRAKHTVL